MLCLVKSTDRCRKQELSACLVVWQVDISHCTNIVLAALGIQ